MFLFIVAIGAVYFVAYTTYSDFKATKQRTLYYQLQILRMGINIYQLVEHRDPTALEDLVKKSYQLPGDLAQKRFVEVVAADANGQIFDPFGNPYFYDPITGWVRSTSSGYEFW